MDAVSPLPALAALFAAIATIHVLTRLFGTPPGNERYSSIAGLRGYLAFLVFLHHAVIWYFYLQTGRWDVPPSRLYTHFGQTSVALFFMVTAFLFSSKLLEGRSRPIDWLRLYVSRVLRLVPLYMLAMLVLFAIVGFVSGWQLRETPGKLAGGVVKWLFFTVRGHPDLNGVRDTNLIVAGLTWTLAYEWFFYFSLPLLALIVGAAPPRRMIALGVGGVLLYFAIADHHAEYAAPFLGGIAAALLNQRQSFKRFAVTRTGSFIALACLGTTVYGFATAYQAAPIALLSVTFALIACGNDLFGILVSRTSRSLGEPAYSIYLLQGLLLYAVFSLVIGPAGARALSPEGYWTAIVLLTPLLVTISFASFHWVEQPAMKSVARLTNRLRAARTGRPRAAS